MLAGCGGTTNPSSGAADLVPASVPLFVALDTDLDSAQWQAVDKLSSKFPDKQKAIDSINQQLLKKGLDWNRDLKPALGPELDVVTLDLAHPDETVAMMQPKDEGAFERAVKKGNAGDPSSKLVYEKFNGWTLMSDKQSAIDAFKRASDGAKRTLSGDKNFSSAMARNDGLFRAYVNGASVMAAARQFMGPDAGSYFKKLGTLDWLLMTLRAKSDGIGWDTTVHGTPGKAFKNVGSHRSDGSLQKLVPKDALLYLAFHGSKGMLGGLGGNPILQQFGAKGFGDALQQAGRVLEGENALYVRAAAGTKTAPEVTFIAAPSGGLDGAAALDRVLKRFAKELGGQPQRTKIAGVSARVVGAGPVAVRYANVKGRLVITDLPSGIVFAQNGGQTLADSQEYQDAARSSGLPTSPQVVLYVDIHSTLPVIDRLGGARIPAGLQQSLKPLRSALEYAVSRSHELQISFFLRIK